MRSVKSASSLSRASSFIERDSTKNRRRRCEEREGADPSARHVPSAKIENLGARAPCWRGDKGNGCSYGGDEEDGRGQGTRRPGKIRNKKLGPGEPRPTACRCRSEDGPFALARREVGGSLVLSSWEVAADVPTRLARARCHLAAKKTVPSAPSSSLPLCPLPSTPSPLFVGPPLSPFLAVVACVHASPPRGSDTKLLSATENGIQASFIRESAVVDPPAAGSDLPAIRPRKALAVPRHYRVKFLMLGFRELR